MTHPLLLGALYGYCHCGCGKPAPIAKYNANQLGWVKGHPKRFISGHNSVRRRLPPRYGFIDGEPVVFISLGGDREAVVDAGDYPAVAVFRWGFNCGYACRYAKERGKRTLIRLHQDLVGKWFDHENRNKLDNRRSNLRPATRAQNAQNYGLRHDNKTGVRGVSFHRLTGKYQAQINHDGKREYLGLFDTIEDAMARRVVASEKFHGAYKGRITSNDAA